MSDEKPQDPPAPEDASTAAEGDAISLLVKRSMMLEGSRREGDSPPDVLRGVQRKIRQRSRGKFFADGWSTTNARFSYVLVAVVMLIILGVAYFALAWVTVR
jgi:hypothetical protein